MQLASFPQWNRQYSENRVKVQCEVGRARTTKPEMLALMGFAAVAIEAGLEIIVAVSLSQEKFAFVE